jgi:hypothetical protein
MDSLASSLIGDVEWRNLETWDRGGHMNRAELEDRLLRDPLLRKNMESVENAAKRLRRAQEEVLVMGALRDSGAAYLANEGVPLATIARLVGVTPQRLGVIVRSVTDRATEEMPWPIQALKRSLGLPDDAPDQQVFDALESREIDAPNFAGVTNSR